jgi:G3E family GTPase
MTELKAMTPVTIITGHLGSGKTTFIQEVLGHYQDKNFLVIENEFGEIGIDGEILKNDENALVELNNGCICCNIQTDLNDILKKYGDEASRFDHVIIEATGVANPAKIARLFVVPSYYNKNFDLNSIICVIDGKNYKRHQELPEFELQLLTSDRFLISKLDDENDPELERINLELALEPNSVVSKTDGLDWFLDKTFFDLDENISQKGNHSHYQKISFEIPGEFDPITLERYLNVLYLQHMGGIIRSKGLLHFRKYDYPVIFQAVFDSMDFKEIAHRDNSYHSNEKVNRFTFIGENLDESKIAAGFRNCIAD